MAYEFRNFILGKDLPVPHVGHQMVSSSNKQALYTIGTYGRKDIYRFSCNESITDCEWSKLENRLQHDRYFHVAFNIPDKLAKKLCKPGRKKHPQRNSKIPPEIADSMPGNFSSWLQHFEKRTEKFSNRV